MTKAKPVNKRVNNTNKANIKKASIKASSVPSLLAYPSTISTVSTTSTVSTPSTLAKKANQKTNKLNKSTTTTPQKPKKRLAKTYQKTKSATKAVARTTKTATKKIAKGTKVATIKVAKTTKKGYKKAHKHVAQKPHEKLMAKFPRYNRWHSWNYKKLNSNHIHGTILASWTLLVIMAAGSFIQNVSALSTWTQTDWSGGVGTNATTQYASKNNIEATGSGLSVSPDEKLTNGGFETNIDGWKYTANDAKFESAKITSAGTTRAYEHAIGDLNNDGLLDIAIADPVGGRIQIYYALDNNGNLSTPTTISIDHVSGITIADFNNDSHLDLAAAINSLGQGAIYIYTNNWNGTFTLSSHPVGGVNLKGPYSIGVADFNNDSKVDIISSVYAQNRIAVSLNQGNGSYVVSYYDISGPVYFDTGDLNNDGFEDIVVPNWNSNSFSVLLNTGLGSFASGGTYITSPSSDSSRTVKIGDLNSDGFLDVAVANYVSKSVAIFRGDSEGLLALNQTINLPTGPHDLVITDLDNDGIVEIVTSNFESAGSFIFRQKADRQFSTPTMLPTMTSSFRILSRDMNNDSLEDLVVISYTQIGIYLNASDQPEHTTDQNFIFNETDGAIKIISTSDSGVLSQTQNIESTDSYYLEAYAYTDGLAVTSADVSLYVGSVTVPTTYTDVGGGWYKLSATVTGTASSQKYGVQVEAGKTIYLDNLSLHTYASGTLASAIYDATMGAAWDTLSYTTTGSGSTVVKVRSSNNADMSGAPAFAGCAPVSSGNDLTGESCVTDNHRYIQYEVTLTGSGATTPTLTNMSIGYTPYDNTAPTSNASNISMKRGAGGDSVSSGSWTNGNTPYFEWTAGEDNSGGTGVKGYCLYLGTDSSADPVTSKGNLGNSTLDTEGACPFAVSASYIDTATAGYIGTALSSSNDLYYLNIKAIDNAHNVYNDSSAQFSFKFDNTPPKNPDYINAPSQFVSNKEVTMTWPTSGGNSASDGHSGLSGLQYRIGSNGTWYGDAHNGSGDASDLLADDGSYTTVDPPDFSSIVEGNNVVYFRTWDNAGNASTAYVTTVIKYNSSAASSPQNVSASPSVSNSNNFGFSWVAPATFQGDVNNISYCYTINTLPNANTCTWTDAGVTSLPAGAYATQPGENTFYVVARDETMVVNYATAASTTFTANTSAPGLPQDVEIADVSTRATSTWRLALSWSEPLDTGVGVASYRLARSTDGTNFTQVASTAGTSYVDSSLSKDEYFYKVRACDSANNCGAYSGIVRMTPTGKFTEPATLVSQPSATVSTRNASIVWSTDRGSDSRIQYGTSSGKYFTTEAAASLQTKNHNIELANLDAGTTYFYRARWTDEDGNIGTSSELSFTTMPAPTVKSVTVLRTTLSTAMIQFTVKNSTQVKLFYGKTDNFGGVKTVNTSFSESTYTIELDGLDDGTRYYFGINPIDSDDNEYQSTRVDEFITPARPRINSLQFQPIEGEPTSTQKVTWITNVPTSSLVRFNSKDIPTREHTKPGLSTEHEIVVRELQDDTEYSIVAESRDQDGNLAISDTHTMRTALDTRPPKVSDITIETTIRGTGAEARGQIVVSWKTDEPSTSQVAYGEGSQITTFNNKTAEDSSLALEHIVIVSDLPTSRVYSVQPISKDRANNNNNGEIKSTIIGKASDSVLTIVLGTLKKIVGF